MEIYIVFENVLCNYDVQKKKIIANLRNINKIKQYCENNLNNKIHIWSSFNEIYSIIKFLDIWNIKYDFIKLCKPKFDLLIDENTINTI